MQSRLTVTVWNLKCLAFYYATECSPKLVGARAGVYSDVEF